MTGIEVYFCVNVQSGQTRQDELEGHFYTPISQAGKDLKSLALDFEGSEQIIP